MAFHWRTVWKNVGPGITTGASDDDPSGIATYAQAGAQFSFGALWTIAWSLPLMIAVQEMASRLALATGRGLARNLRHHIPKPFAFGIVLLILGANTLNLGADLGMMAASTRLLLPVPFPILLIFFTIASVALQIFLSYRTYARYLKWMAFSLVAYAVVGFVIRADVWQALKGTFIPRLIWDKDYLLMLVAIFGTTISPYLCFWQADQEVEEEIARGHIPDGNGRATRRVSRKEIHWMRIDSAAGMTFSNIIAWFIVFTAAGTLFAGNGVLISGPDAVAQMLAPIAGSFASVLFTVGVIGAGLLTVPILSGTAAYALIELLDMDGGPSRTWRQAKSFYGVILLVNLIGLAVNFFGLDPIRLLIYAAVGNGLAAPFVISTLVFLCNNRALMGRWINHRAANVLGFATVALMTALPIAWIAVASL